MIVTLFCCDTDCRKLLSIYPQFGSRNFLCCGIWIDYDWHHSSINSLQVGIHVGYGDGNDMYFLFNASIDVRDGNWFLFPSKRTFRSHDFWQLSPQPTLHCIPRSYYSLTVGSGPNFLSCDELCYIRTSFTIYTCSRSSYSKS